MTATHVQTSINDLGGSEEIEKKNCENINASQTSSSKIAKVVKIVLP